MDTNFVNEYNRVKQNIENAYDAIIAGGGTVEQTRNSENLASSIGTIQSGTDTSDATAVASDIISPKTAYANGKKIEGSINTTYRTSESFISNIMATNITMENARILQCEDNKHLICFCQIDTINYICICEYNLDDNFITITNKYKYSDFNFVNVLDNKSASLSTEINNVHYLYIGYDNDVNILIVDFNNNTIEFSTKVTFDNKVHEVICNPKYPNKCYINYEVSGQEQKIPMTITFDGSTASIKSWSGLSVFNAMGAIYTYRMHISDDGRVLLFSGYRFRNEHIPYIVLLTNGDYKTHIRVNAGDNFIGINPSGTKVYIANNIYKLDRTDSSLSVSQIGTMSVSYADMAFGYSFIDDYTFYTCDYKKAAIYKLDKEGLNPELIDTLTITRPAMNLIHNNFTFLANSTDIYSVGYPSLNIIASLERNNQIFYNTSDATALTNDVIASKTIYGVNGKITGTMPNNGELNYTPTTEEQTIPAGYTSGGKISAAILSVDDYNTCNILATSILEGALPYIELEYIESTGTQCIDTGIVPKSTTRMVLDVALIDVATKTNRNGWGSSGNQEAFYYGTVSSKETFLGVVNSSWDAIEMSSKDTERHIADISNNAIKLDDITYGTGNIGDTASDNQTLYIGALHTEYITDEGNYYAGAKEKVYSCKIYDGETLVRDFIPAKETSTNEVCLYDKVEGKFYYNAGSGEFIAGGVV